LAHDEVQDVVSDPIEDFAHLLSFNIHDSPVGNYYDRSFSASKGYFRGFNPFHHAGDILRLSHQLGEGVAQFILKVSKNRTVYFRPSPIVSCRQ
jgi:hypothetical protein